MICTSVKNDQCGIKNAAKKIARLSRFHFKIRTKSGSPQIQNKGYRTTRRPQGRKHLVVRGGWTRGKIMILTVECCSANQLLDCVSPPV